MRCGKKRYSIRGEACISHWIFLYTRASIMGIQGLLPQLKPIQHPVSLNRYSGETLAIDGYAWLHRAACSCAYELAMDLPTDKYLKFFIKKFSMLKMFNIEPYLVFDGDGISVKKETEHKRRNKRVENKAIAQRLWKSGEKSNAMDYFQKCVDVTPEMAKCIIEYCRLNGIKYVVAPFEADSQMVYLEKKNLVQGIISEDSDLLVFGCKRLITKLNDFGECIEICRDDFDKLPQKFALGQFDDSQLRSMVCLSGCDYTSGIPKIGLMTAWKLIKQYQRMDKALLAIQRDGKWKIPSEFSQEYALADFAFQFQRVFCPLQNKIVTLNELTNDFLQSLSDSNKTVLFKSIGDVYHKDAQCKQCIINDTDIDHELHTRIAYGELNPYDCRRPLVNRERKLQLVSKSETVINKPIDSFFSRNKKRTVLATADKNKQLQKMAMSLKQGLQDKLSRSIERRKLSNANSAMDLALVDSSLATPIKSKFFAESKSSCDEDDIETEVPESALPTQVPSSLVPISASAEASQQSNDSTTTLNDESLPHRSNSILVAAKITNFRSRSLTDENNTTTSMLQQFRYSSSSSDNNRRPLGERNPNANGRVHLHDLPSKKQETKSAVNRPATRHLKMLGATSSCTPQPYRNIRTLSQTSHVQGKVTKPSAVAGTARVAKRSVSLLSEFMYRGNGKT